MENLARFASVIESSFIGRRDRPQLVKDQFESFWNATYRGLEIPCEGWPGGIQQCLDTDIDVETERASSPLPPSSPTCSVYEPGRARTPERPAVIVSETLLTPKLSSISYNSSPACRLENISEAHFPKLPSISPTSPSQFRTAPLGSISATPTTPKCAGKRTFSAGPDSASMTTPKSKRRRIEEGEDKENASPSPAALAQIPSVMERIAMRSPLGVVGPSSNRKVSTAIKRQLEAESKEEGVEEGDGVFTARPSCLKKGKFDKTAFGRKRSESVSSDDDVEETNVPVSNESGKRYFMEAVEIPPFERVLFNKQMRSANLDGAQTPSSGGRIIRRMKSSGKRMNTKLDSFVSSSSPIRVPRAGRKLTVAGFSRTMNVPTAMSKSCSSDDDPRYGQVAPHHLISPVPKNFLDLFDPPSDDSLLSSSPTKSAASRRIRRSSST